FYIATALPVVPRAVFRGALTKLTASCPVPLTRRRAGTGRSGTGGRLSRVSGGRTAVFRRTGDEAHAFQAGGAGAAHDLGQNLVARVEIGPDAQLRLRFCAGLLLEPGRQVFEQHGL